MTGSVHALRLTAYTDPSELLGHLKDLKNSIIGNTRRKVEIANDEPALFFLLNILGEPMTDPMKLQIAQETAVILGSLANVGSPAVKPLIFADAPARLLDLISATKDVPAASRLLPHILRALRNILVATADVTWGHLRGVVVPQKIVKTGLEDADDTSESPVPRSPKGKEVVGRDWKTEARQALGLVFEAHNLDYLTSLLQSDTQICLSIYQIYARLAHIPRYRSALIACDPTPKIPAVRVRYSLAPDVSEAIPPGPPFIVRHILENIYDATCDLGQTGLRPAVRTMESVLDLLANLVADVYVADIVRSYQHPDWEDSYNTSSGLLRLAEHGPGVGVRIAALSCLGNLRSLSARTSDEVSSTLLDAITQMIRTEDFDTKIQLCFIIPYIVSSSESLQLLAVESGSLGELLTLAREAIGPSIDPVNLETSSRAQEGVLLALAALSMDNEPARTIIAGSSPPFLPLLRTALQHSSYGVRAAACQLTRAMSRTIAVLRTSLVDSGVGEALIECLKAEAKLNREGETDAEDELGDLRYTVQVTATAAVCNLAADFSPLQRTLVNDGGLELLCSLTQSPYEPLALNALWAIKNLVFHSSDGLKTEIMMVFGWTSLRQFLGEPTLIPLRKQALEILQNLLAEATSADITKTLERLGEGQVLDILQELARDRESPLCAPSLYVISNLALGSEKTRNLLVGRVDMIEALSEAVNEPMSLRTSEAQAQDLTQVPALLAIRHLVESTTRNRRPRQTVIDVFQPYQLRTRLRDLIDNSGWLDVSQAAAGLLDVLEKGK